jgi:ubiquinone/menaquinone biosynthesis C-methylase UbiE
MESYPEQYSERARLQLIKTIHSMYSQSGQDVFSLANNLLDLRPDEDLLDIGCGIGDFLMNLRKGGHLGKLYGIDRIPSLVEEARIESSAKGLHVDFRISDATTLGFPSASFHCVTALDSLEEADPGKILAEIGRVLKAEGRVVISANSRNCYPLLEELIRRTHDRFGWFRTGEWKAGFISESALDLLRRYFGKVEEFRYDETIRYPDAEVLVDFFRSTRGIWDETLTQSEWERIVDWARDQAIELIPEHGYAEDPRVFSLFRCTEPLGF